VFDLSFPAWRRPSLGLDSLGVRPSALPLRLSIHPGYRTTSSSFRRGLPAGSHSLQQLLSHLRVRGQQPRRRTRGHPAHWRNLCPDLLSFLAPRGKRGRQDRPPCRRRHGPSSDEGSLGRRFERLPPAGERSEEFATLRLMPTRCPVCAWDFQPSPTARSICV